MIRVLSGRRRFAYLLASIFAAYLMAAGATLGGHAARAAEFGAFVICFGEPGGAPPADQSCPCADLCRIAASPMLNVAGPAAVAAAPPVAFRADFLLCRPARAASPTEPSARDPPRPV